MANAAAEILVGRVVGAQGVAVHQQRRHPIQVDPGGVGEQRHAGPRGVAFGQHEVAVAVHEIHRRARSDQRREPLRRVACDRFVVVVADPGFEQVAEDVERVRPGHLVLQEAKKTPGGSRAFVGEVQVGNEVGATRAWFCSQAHRSVRRFPPW